MRFLQGVLQDFVNVQRSSGRPVKIETSDEDVLILPADLLLNCTEEESQV